MNTMTISDWVVKYRDREVRISPDNYGGFVWGDSDTYDYDPDYGMSGVIGTAAKNTTLGELFHDIRESVDRYLEVTA